MELGDGQGLDVLQTWRAYGALAELAAREWRNLVEVDRPVDRDFINTTNEDGRGGHWIF